jgi:hypothetical protein
VSVCANCTLNGRGTVSADVINLGSVAPGTVGSLPAAGTLTVSGNYTQSGVLDELIGSSGNGLLKVGGSVTLGTSARLMIDLLNGFRPTVGETFDVVNYGAGQSGDFANASSPTFAMDGWDWSIDYAYKGSEVLLTAVAPTGTVSAPEPASWALLTLGLLALAARWWLGLPRQRRLPIQRSRQRLRWNRPRCSADCCNF